MASKQCGMSPVRSWRVRLGDALLGSESAQRVRSSMALIALVVYLLFAVGQHGEVLLGLVEFFEGKDPQAFVAKQRIHHQYLPDAISAEPGALTAEEAAALRARGHTVNEGERPWGNMQAVVWDLRDNRLHGGSDPRGLVGKAEVK